MNRRVLSIFVVFAIILSAGIGITVWLSPTLEDKTRNLSDQDILAVLQELEDSGGFLTAYQRAQSWLETNPPRADVARRAGQLAVITKDFDGAHRYMTTAWELGAKRFPVMIVIIETMDGAVADKIETFDQLFEDLEKTRENLNAKARFYSQVGRNREALEIWESLNQAAPEERIIMQMARKLEMTGRRQEALTFLRANEEHLKAEGFNLWASLLAFSNAFEQAEQVIERASELSDPHGEWALKQALYPLLKGDIKSASKQLSMLIDAGTDHPVALVVSHQARIYSALLETILLGKELSLERHARIAEAEMPSFPNRDVTTPLLGFSAGPKQIEAEQILYSYLEAASQGRERPEMFIRLEPFLRDSAVVRWLGIRNALVSGRAAEAVELYNAIDELHPLQRVEGESGFFYKSPLFITEAARALLLAGSEREAMNLINHLHERELYSPATIRIFAQITQNAGFSRELYEMQEALGRQFPKDLDIQLNTINQAYELGNTDRALELISPLRQVNEDNIDLKMLELMLLIEQGDSTEALKRLDTIELPMRNQSLVRARIAIAQEDRAGADQHFQQAVDNEDFFGYLDYARFLVEERRLSAALKLYNAVLEREIDNVVALQGLGIIKELEQKPVDAIQVFERILRIEPDNAYAHTRLAKLHLQTQNPRNAIHAANKALNLDPESADASYLQITAMIQLALEQTVPVTQKRRLIAAQERLSEVSRESETSNLFLHIYLAAAYRDIGEKDRSIEIYEYLLAMDETIWETVNMSRSDVERALENLSP